MKNTLLVLPVLFALLVGAPVQALETQKLGVPTGVKAKLDEIRDARTERKAERAEFVEERKEDRDHEVQIARDVGHQRDALRSRVRKKLEHHRENSEVSKRNA